MEQCGETDGDCFKYFMKNFNMFWNSIEAKSTDRKTWTYFKEEPRECGPKDVG